MHSVQSERRRVRAERAEIEFQLKALEAAGKGQADRLMGILMSAPGLIARAVAQQAERAQPETPDAADLLHRKAPAGQEVTHEIEAVRREVQRELQSNQQAATAREASTDRR